jgi:hypothetical protein
MQYVCDAAGGKAWFRIETEAEAARESELMRHAVEKHFRRAHEQASQAYRPASGPYIEQGLLKNPALRVPGPSSSGPLFACDARSCLSRPAQPLFQQPQQLVNPYAAETCVRSAPMKWKRLVIREASSGAHRWRSS